MAECSAGASAGDGGSGEHRRTGWRPSRICLQAQRRHEGLRRIAAGTWRNSRSHRRADSGDSGCLVLLDVDLLAWKVIRELCRENIGPKTWKRTVCDAILDQIGHSGVDGV